MHPTSIRVACDSMVALSAATADGSVLFAKNSDRPAMECQPLAFVPRGRHARPARLRCTYIEIAQVGETAQVIGSRPYWCWGFEHGLNEHGVAIGNHTIFAKDALGGLGLIGMDLVRLGLERATSAATAVEVIVALLEEHGQGGSGYADKDWPYHNSFLIADRGAAYILETSDRQWALKDVAGLASASNHVTIGTDWSRLSPLAVAHARQEGWWSEPESTRFDFAAAYRDLSMVPPEISSGRYGRTCERLRGEQGAIDVATLRQTLRDHYGAVLPNEGLTPMDERYFGVCMHAEPVGTTTASVIAHLPHAAGEPVTYWASLASPCVSAFLPLYVDAGVPEMLTRSSVEPSPESPWWRCKQLLGAVEQDWSARAPIVRAELDEFEAATQAALVERPAQAMNAAQRLVFSTERAVELLRRVENLLGRFAE